MDFRDLGYLTYYATYLLATGQIKGDVGEAFVAGRMGEYKIEEDPGRAGSKRILMGPFTVYNKDNVEAAAEIVRLGSLPRAAFKRPVVFSLNAEFRIMTQPVLGNARHFQEFAMTKALDASRWRSSRAKSMRCSARTARANQR